MEASWLKLKANLVCALLLCLRQIHGLDFNSKTTRTGFIENSLIYTKSNSIQTVDAKSLVCHQCHSFAHGDKCIHLDENSTVFATKCSSQQEVCVVKQFSYTENATSLPVIWSVERNCSSQCEPGYIVLGERTKLYVSISCCNTRYCNTGNEATNPQSSQSSLSWTVPILSFFTCISLRY